MLLDIICKIGMSSYQRVGVVEEMVEMKVG